MGSTFTPTKTTTKEVAITNKPIGGINQKSGDLNSLFHTAHLKLQQKHRSPNLRKHRITIKNKSVCDLTGRYHETVGISIKVKINEENILDLQSNKVEDSIWRGPSKGKTKYIMANKP